MALFLKSVPHLPAICCMTGKSTEFRPLDIDLRLEFFYTDSEGRIFEDPRLLRKSEKALKRKQRKVSKLHLLR